MMSRFRISYLLLVSLIMSVAGTPALLAQRFTVESFRALPNDVSAFINPVKDLNDEGCGLIKVLASDDFVFSTPLGIVKRIDNVGEIWLYLPRGTKKLTIKHADWGVLRDYVLPSRIESHMTYELKIDEPAKAINVAAGTPEVTTVRDTLIVTHVDTLVIHPVKTPAPLNITSVATVSFGGKSNEVLGGVMLMVLKRNGAFVHVSSDFRKIGPTVGECEKDGEIGGSLPFYSGHTRRNAYHINAGAAHRISGKVTVFEGIGYSSNAVAWELAPSEGGGYVRNTYYCTKGLSFEAGAIITFDRLAVSASVITIKGKEWFGSIGVGFRLGK